jgi:excisionase family DNA binding protein
VRDVQSVSLLTVAEVAGRLGVSAATVYKVCAAGRLGHVRVSNAIRVLETALAAYLDPRDPP